MRLHVVDTVLLHNDITENVTMGSSELTVIQHKFMEYGIYQDCGTGRGYEIDGQLYNDGHRGHNKGDLKFLNPGVARRRIDMQLLDFQVAPVTH